MQDKNDSNFMLLVAFNLFLLMVGLLLFVLAAVVTTAQSAELTGKVVGVHDGDTLTLLVAGNQQVKVRLVGIDAPELAQPYGQKSKQALSDLAFGKEARVESAGPDKYGRTLGTVYVGAVNVNAALVSQGVAWVYRQYPHPPELERLEEFAKNNNAGLWALQPDQRIPPWEWRHGGSAKATSAPVSSAPTVAPTASGGGFTCAGKRYCREMTSCGEAKFYLTQCGVRSLDGDKDGVPCEALCQ